MSKIRIRIAATVAALGMALGLGAMPAGAAVTTNISGCASAGAHAETCTWGSPIR